VPLSGKDAQPLQQAGPSLLQVEIFGTSAADYLARYNRAFNTMDPYKLK